MTLKLLCVFFHHISNFIFVTPCSCGEPCNPGEETNARAQVTSTVLRVREMGPADHVCYQTTLSPSKSIVARIQLEEGC